MSRRDAACADDCAVLSSWSNLRWLLQSEQGMGVRPARYSATKGRTTALFKALLLVDDVVGNAKMLSDAAGVVNIIQRTAAAGLGRVWNAVLARQPRLIPKLQSKSNY